MPCQVWHPVIFLSCFPPTAKHAAWDLLTNCCYLFQSHLKAKGDPADQAQSWWIGVLWKSQVPACCGGTWGQQDSKSPFCLTQELRGSTACKTKQTNKHPKTKQNKTKRVTTTLTAARQHHSRPFVCTNYCLVETHNSNSSVHILGTDMRPKIGSIFRFRVLVLKMI